LPDGQPSTYAESTSKRNGITLKVCNSNTCEVSTVTSTLTEANLCICLKLDFWVWFKLNFET